jgi:hypothetical protein
MGALRQSLLLGATVVPLAAPILTDQGRCPRLGVLACTTRRLPQTPCT